MYDDVAGHTINQLPFGRSVGRSASQRPYTGRFSTKCTVHISSSLRHISLEDGSFELRGAANSLNYRLRRTATGKVYIF